MGNRWNKPGIPHKGWTWVNVEDFGEALATCEMCDQQNIRYIHYLEHDEYGQNPIAVGCDCASKMTNDYVNPAAHEKRLKQKARWPDRQWKFSQKGNPTLKVRGTRVYITIFENKYRPGMYRFCINRPDRDPEYSQKSYQDARAAQLASFDAFYEATDGNFEESLSD